MAMQNRVEREATREEVKRTCVADSPKECYSLGDRAGSLCSAGEALGEHLTF
jgi:hypothetical protein